MNLRTVKVEGTTPIAKAEDKAAVRSLIGRLRTKEMPGFVIPIAVVDLLDEDPFDYVTDLFGYERKVPDTPAKTLRSITGGELHTDTILPGATHRLHRIRLYDPRDEPQFGANLSLGRLTGHTPDRSGTRYYRGDDGAVNVGQMHVGELSSGDMTVFELSPDVAHEFINATDETRYSDIRSIGPKQ